MNILKHSISLLVIAIVTLITTIGFVSEAGAYDRKSSNANMVRVDIIPEQLGAGQQAKFNIRMNTHIVELRQDMVVVSVLRDDQGREYRPLSWNGSPAGGHHRNGVLEFPAIANGSKSVTLYLKNIADVPERIFEWKIE